MIIRLKQPLILISIEEKSIMTEVLRGDGNRSSPVWSNNHSKQASNNTKPAYNVVYHHVLLEKPYLCDIGPPAYHKSTHKYFNKNRRGVGRTDTLDTTGIEPRPATLEKYGTSFTHIKYENFKQYLDTWIRIHPKN